MFREWANKLYGASNASATPRTGDPKTKTALGPSASARDAGADADERRTFADRWMMSWTDDDVTFLGEDPYGDCAGNIFAQAAVESRRRSEDAASAPRGSLDEGDRRRSSASSSDAEEKARAFFRIGPM